MNIKVASKNTVIKSEKPITYRIGFDDGDETELNASSMSELEELWLSLCPEFDCLDTVVVTRMEFDDVEDTIPILYEVLSKIYYRGWCTVNDYYAICGKTGIDFVGEQFGWVDLNKFSIISNVIHNHATGKWYIDMPLPVKLNRGETKDDHKRAGRNSFGKAGEDIDPLGPAMIKVGRIWFNCFNDAYKIMISVDAEKLKNGVFTVSQYYDLCEIPDRPKYFEKYGWPYSYKRRMKPHMDVELSSGRWYIDMPDAIRIAE